MYVQINFGRNINNVPMKNGSWMLFQHGITEALFNASNSVPATIFESTVEVHHGMGRWHDAETGELITEESCHISFFDPAGFDLDMLMTDLADLKQRYSQDAIALIVGSELV